MLLPGLTMSTSTKVVVLENVLGFQAVAEPVGRFIDRNCPGHFGLVMGNYTVVSAQ